MLYASCRSHAAAFAPPSGRICETSFNFYTQVCLYTTSDVSDVLYWVPFSWIAKRKLITEAHLHHDGVNELRVLREFLLSNIMNPTRIGLCVFIGTKMDGKQKRLCYKSLEFFTRCTFNPQLSNGVLTGARFNMHIDCMENDFMLSFGQSSLETIEKVKPPLIWMTNSESFIFYFISKEL